MRRLKPLSALLPGLLLAGCATSPPQVLMSTPVIYQQAAVDPFAHLGDSERTPLVSLFYATNREQQGASYGNQVSDALHLGQANVLLGQYPGSWPELYQASISETRDQELPLSLVSAQQLGTLPVEAPLEGPLSEEVRAYIDAIDRELAKARDKQIIIYVHGTKVDFTNAAVLTGELEHFAGRDFVGLAFAWPSHQNIANYLVGQDVHRARRSSKALAQLIDLLARHSRAEGINLIAYSAGGRVTSLALKELHDRHPRMQTAQLQQHYRIGAVVFAAADVPETLFEQRLPAISRISEQVLITMSDRDDALHYAERLMPGGIRIGDSLAEQPLLDFNKRRHLSNVALLDVSTSRIEPTVNIAGHHYWYRHPWVSSDVILLMRTNLLPQERALTQSDHPAVWYMRPDYPDAVRAATRRVLQGQW